MAHDTVAVHIDQILNAIRYGQSEQLKNLLGKGCELNSNFGELNPLYLAIEMDRPNMVALLIEHGVNVNLTIQPFKQHTALQRAVMKGNKEIISIILQHTTSWDTTDTDGASVLHLAMEAPKSWTREDKIIAHLTIFLDLGADIQVKNSRGETALFVAAKYNFQRVVNFLLERRADLNVRDIDGNSLVHYMLNRLNADDQHYKWKNEKEDFIRWLLSNGVDHNFINKAGQSPMHLAVKAKSGKIVELLLENFKDPCGFRDECDATLLHAVLELCEEDLDQVIDRGSRCNSTCTIDKMVDWLLAKGLSVDACDVDGNTAIHIAAKFKRWSVMPRLVERCSNVSAQNHREQTALHLAIDHRNPYLQGYRYAVEALTAKGADIEVRNNLGLNAVQLAAKHKHKWILQYLKDLGSDLSVITASGENLLHLFVSNDYTGNYYLDPGKNECTNSNGLDSFYTACFRNYQFVNDGMVEMLIQEGNHINATNIDGLTPLQVALEARNTKILKELIEHGADVNFYEKRSQFPCIIIAAKYYDSKTHCKDLDILVQAGADVNKTDMSGKTVLHHLVEHRTDVIQKILRAGAFCDVVDEFGYTPIYYAFKVDNYKVVAYLLEAGANLRTVDVKDELKRILRRRDIGEYLVKYERAGLEVAEAFRTSLQYVRGYIENGLVYRCLEEVMELKKVSIDEHRSLHDFLRLNLRGRINCMNYCEKLSSIVEFSNLESNFPVYCDVIMGKYLSSLERKQLLDDAQDVLRRIVGFSMPDICVNDIFRRLDNVDLMRFIDKR